MVHVSRPVRIDAAQQWRHAGEIVKVRPVDKQSRRPGDRDQMDGVVGRTAGGVQADYGVCDGPRIDDVGQGGRLVAAGNNGDCPARRLRLTLRLTDVGGFPGTPLGNGNAPLLVELKLNSLMYSGTTAEQAAYVSKISPY